jgi:hypothetical protein
MSEQSIIETMADLYIHKISLLSIEEQQEIQNRLNEKFAPKNEIANDNETTTAETTTEQEATK